MKIKKEKKPNANATKIVEFHQSIDLIRKSHTPYVVSGNMFTSKQNNAKAY